jgi:fluoride exporter
MSILKVLWYVASGGALGAIARFGVYRGLLQMGGPNFPFATLVVNAFGSLLAGGLVVLCNARWPQNQGLQAFAIVGFLGAFTTFSAFSVDTLALLQSGAQWKAFVNIGVNVGLSLGCCALGMQLAR